MAELPPCLLEGTAEANDAIGLYNVLRKAELLNGSLAGRSTVACGRCGLRETVRFPLGKINSDPREVGVEVHSGAECHYLDSEQYEIVIAAKYSGVDFY